MPKTRLQKGVPHSSDSPYDFPLFSYKVCTVTGKKHFWTLGHHHLNNHGNPFILVLTSTKSDDATKKYRLTPNYDVTIFVWTFFLDVLSREKKSLMSLFLSLELIPNIFLIIRALLSANSLIQVNKRVQNNNFRTKNGLFICEFKIYGPK